MRDARVSVRLDHDLAAKAAAVAGAEGLDLATWMRAAVLRAVAKSGVAVPDEAAQASGLPIPIRLTPAQLAALNRAAGDNRSDFIRRAVAAALRRR